jgi:hypothetical protein
MHNPVSTMHPDDIVVGQSWGCRYRVTRMLGEDGTPVRNLQIGQTAAGPGVVEGTAIIKSRDQEKGLLLLADLDTHEEFVVSYADVWDIDTIIVVDDVVDDK